MYLLRESEVIAQRESRSIVRNTTDRSVVGHLNAFGLYLYEVVRNGGGRGGNCSATIELDQIAPPSTESELYHLHATLIASGCVQVLGSG